MGVNMALGYCIGLCLGIFGMVLNKNTEERERINLFLDKKLKNDVNEYRKKSGIGYSALIVGLLEKWIEQQKLIDKILEEPQNKRVFENMKKANIISAKKMRENGS